MVARERQEGRTAPVPETNTRVLKETSLAELGIDTSYDNLNLAGDRFTLGVKKVEEDAVFVGQLNHPFAGAHFAQFLNSVSPFTNQGLRGIIADIALPIRAERDYQEGEDKTTSDDIRLHERHLQDPRVGPAYKRFAEEHVDKWLKALEINTDLGVFETLQRIIFIANIQDYVRQLFIEWREGLRSPEKVNETYIDLSQVVFKYHHQEKAFMDYFRRNVNLKEREWVYDRFRETPLNERKELLGTFLEKLIEAEKEQFALKYIFEAKDRVLVDRLKKQIWQGRRYNESVKFKFVDEKSVELGDDEGTMVRAIPNRSTGSGTFDWGVTGYKFSPEYLKTSLYPIIAWKKDRNGTRNFLTQQEAMPLVKELGLEEGKQGDVKLGEIAVVYFDRDITQDWKRKMALAPLEGTASSRGDDFEQSMGGAQMPGWVAVEQHKAQLLKSETSVLARSEKHLASVS